MAVAAHRRAGLARVAAAAWAVLVWPVPPVSSDVTPPAEVRLLTVTVDDDGDDLVLGWQAVSTDLTGVAETVPRYRVYSVSFPSFVPGAPLGEPVSNSFTDSGAFADANSHFYLVSAVDDGPIEGNRRPGKVGPVAIVSLSVQGGSGVLTWTPAVPQSELAGYRVFWGTASLAYGSSFDVGAGLMTASFGPLGAGSVYYATVLAVDSEGNLSPFIGEASIDLSGAGATPPSITASLSPAPNEHGWNKGDTTVTFSCSGAGGTLKPNSQTAAVGPGFSNAASAWDGNFGTAAQCDGDCGGDFGFLDVGTFTGHVEVVVSANHGCLGASEADGYYWDDILGDWSPFFSVTFPGNDPLPFSSDLLNVDMSTFRVRIIGDPNCGDPAGDDTFVYEVGFVTEPTCPVPVVVTTEGAQQVASGTATGAGGSTTIRVPVSLDKTPPAIDSAVSPTPNAASWNNTNAVVSFACTDALSGVASCNGPVTVTAEGPDQSVPATATDLAGNVGQATASVSIDKTPPELTLDQPADGALIGALTVPISGAVADDHLAGVTCNGSAAAVDGIGYSCLLTFSDGSYPTISVEARDLADNTTSEAVDVQVDRVGVSILSPEANARYAAADLQNGTIPVFGTVDDLQAEVFVNDVAAVVQPDGIFTATGVPLKDGNNLLTATATAGSGAAGTASVLVTLDLQPPTILIDYPPHEYATTASSVVVAGMLNDIVVGTVNEVDETRVVVINLMAPAALPPAAVKNRSFLTVPVPLVYGSNTIHATGYDAVGNQGATEITVIRGITISAAISPLSPWHQSGGLGEELAQPLKVLVQDGSTAVPGKTVIFEVRENDGILRCLTQGTGGGESECALPDVSATGRSVAVTTDANGEALAYWTLGHRAGSGNNTVHVQGVQVAGEVIYLASGEPGEPARISVDAGNLQTGAAGEPLPRPFVAVVTDAGHNRLQGVPVTFSVQAGGGRFGPQSQTYVIYTDPDGLAAATLTLGPGEGFDDNVVQATFLDGEGNPSAPATFIASGRVPMDAANTRISGVVVDNTDTPLEGVTMRIHGHEDLETTTDDQGQFTLFGVPTGKVMLVADGSTIADGQDWPELHYEMVTVAGRDNTVNMPIYLLPLDPGGESTLHVSPSEGGTITLPDIPGFALEIEPGSVTFPGPSDTGDVSVTVVHADKIPMVPNFGAQPRLAITIQPPGTKFDPPAKVTFPNVHGLAPGEITELLSFDHDLGQFVAIGTGTVSKDGQVVVSDPGVGILEGGWHSDCGCAGPTGRPFGRSCASDLEFNDSCVTVSLSADRDPDTYLPIRGDLIQFTARIFPPPDPGGQVIFQFGQRVDFEFADGTVTPQAVQVSGDSASVSLRSLSYWGTLTLQATYVNSSDAVTTQLQLPTDADHDTIADSWELRPENGATLAQGGNPLDATWDEDTSVGNSNNGDGFSKLTEYMGFEFSPTGLGGALVYQRLRAQRKDVLLDGALLASEKPFVLSGLLQLDLDVHDVSGHNGTLSVFGAPGTLGILLVGLPSLSATDNGVIVSNGVPTGNGATLGATATGSTPNNTLAYSFTATISNLFDVSKNNVSEAEPTWSFVWGHVAETTGSVAYEAYVNGVDLDGDGTIGVVNPFDLLAPSVIPPSTQNNDTVDGVSASTTLAELLRRVPRHEAGHGVGMYTTGFGAACPPPDHCHPTAGDSVMRTFWGPAKIDGFSAADRAALRFK